MTMESVPCLDRRIYADARALLHESLHLALVRHSLQQARYELDDAEDELQTLGLQSECLATCRAYLDEQCRALSTDMERVATSLMQNLLANGANSANRGN
jgi:hypothetical protein